MRSAHSRMLAVALAMSIAPEAFQSSPPAAKERHGRTREDIAARAEKRAAKLARRAARHKAEARGDAG